MIEKRFFLLICSLISLAYASPAQDYSKYLQLSYAEIDSLLGWYESEYQFTKGFDLSMAISKKAEKNAGQQDSLCGEYLEWAAYFCELNQANEKAIHFCIQALAAFEN